MKAVSLYAGAYWGPRRETLDACAERADAFMEGLRSLDPALATWYKLGRSRRDALRHQVLIEHDVLRKLLESGRNRRDFDRTVIEELGYSMFLWNGQEPSIGLHIGCGVSSPYVTNVVVIDLPRSDEDLGKLASAETARNLMRLLVQCWDPEWSTLSSHDWREEQEVQAGEAVLGWMTYIRWVTEPLDLPPRVAVEHLGPGSLVIAAPELAMVSGRQLTAIRQALASDLRRP